MRPVSVEKITLARRVIDPVFVGTPLLTETSLDRVLGVRVAYKVETLNPIRSFKGRGTDFFVQQIPRGEDLVCASAGNFGQGLARAGIRRGLRVTVFAGKGANELKLSAMRALGAEVIQRGNDFDAAKVAAKEHANEHGGLYVEDGAWAEIAEGAGTIAAEINSVFTPDVILVPVGNGALITGIGTWLKHVAPSAEIIGVVAAGAPSMRLSFAQHRTVPTSTADTIADGIAVREPVRYSVTGMAKTVDEVVTVDDDAMVKSMKLLHEHLGLVVEPSGAAGPAAVLTHGSRWRESRVATVLTGGNLTPEQVKLWL